MRLSALLPDRKEPRFRLFPCEELKKAAVAPTEQATLLDFEGSGMVLDMRQLFVLYQTLKGEYLEKQQTNKLTPKKKPPRGEEKKRSGTHY